MCKYVLIVPNTIPSLLCMLCSIYFGNPMINNYLQSPIYACAINTTIDIDFSIWTVSLRHRLYWILPCKEFGIQGHNGSHI